MYGFQRCAVPECASLAFGHSDRCLSHQNARTEAIAAATALLTTQESIKDLNLAGISLEGIDLSKRRFIGCSFIGATIRNTLFTNAAFRLCFFDGAAIESCDFSTSDAQFCSFGATKILNSSFENSELLHCNFDGSHIKESTFNSSNLYDSRFIRCELESSDFINCDFKRVYLIPSKQENVSFKSSNTAEAISDLEHLYL